MLQGVKMAFKSKEEQAKYHKEVWYPKNKARRVELNLAWRKKIREQYQDYKKTLSCLVCGENEPACLDFHHTNPSEKEMAVREILNKNRSFARLMEEVKKCVVLCSNCHRKFHAGIIKLP
jgi:5-methylcytosine-specific restriction endonuclease McrA